MYKNRKFKKSALMLALIMVVILFASGLALASETVNVVEGFSWEGNGSEHATCDGVNADWHWILTPGGNNIFEEATLFVTFEDGTELQTDGYIQGQDRGAMHFNILKADGGTVDSAYVDFTYTGTGTNFVLTISSLECDDPIEEETGTLTIVKEVVDGEGSEVEGDETSFYFTIEGQDGQVIIIGSGSSDPIVLPVGTYKVTEVLNEDEHEDYELINATVAVGDAELDDANGILVEVSVDGNTVTFINELDEGGTIGPEDPGGNGDDDDGTIDDEDPAGNGDDDNGTIDDEDPAGNGEEAEEDDDEETLPVTSGMDALLLGLGAAMTTGGLVIRRRKRK